MFEVSMEDLQKVPGVGISVAAHIRAIGHFFEKYREKKEPEYLGEFSSRSFLPFVKKAYKDELYEVADLYLLDGNGRIMKKQRFSVASISSVEVLPEDFSSFLLTQGALGVVLVHNHPFGEAVPSNSDETMTKNCQMLCSLNNRLFCDHIIYAPSGIYSYYLSGRLREISENYSAVRILDDKKDEK